MNTETPIAAVEAVKAGLMADFSNTAHPSMVYGLDGGALNVTLPEGVTEGTAFGCVYEGRVLVTNGLKTYVVQAGEYFSLPMASAGLLALDDGKDNLPQVLKAKAVITVRLGYTGLASMGGPVEDVGRLMYIDGCSDTLLIGPPLRGDPCQNFLRFPPGIEQTMHTHPSIRAGIILSGSGVCRTAHGDKPLTPGDVFILYPDAIHAFSTADSDGMTLSVFHPDTDTGPSHDDHPMLNRTIVDGVSAAKLDDIRTRKIS